MYPITDWLRRLRIILFHWEYWPAWIVYLPAGIYYLWLSARAGSFYFFSAANPGIENGGMFFESKWSIFRHMPAVLYPATVLIENDRSDEHIAAALNTHGISYPFIAKPDRGERGWAVQKINNPDELKVYCQRVKVPFLIQAYTDLPIEYSVFYYRHPGMDKGVITSLTRKELLSVTGTGRYTLLELVRANDRAFLQQAALLADAGFDPDEVLPEGVHKVLVPYGNHSRGAKFIDETCLADEALAQVFDAIAGQIAGFYFGRFDLRTRSLEDLKQGRDFFIVELNGAGAEPAHIYTPGYSFLKAQADIIRHFHMMWKVAMHFKQRHPFMTARQYKTLKTAEKAYKAKVA